MAIAWPAGVKYRFLEQGFSRTPVPGAVQNQFDTGPKGQHATTTATGETLSGQMKMPVDQWKDFRDWGRDTLGKWALRAEWPADHETGAPVEIQFDALKPPTAVKSTTGPDYLVSVSFETLP